MYLKHNDSISLEEVLEIIEKSYFILRLENNPVYYNFDKFTIENKYDL